jgi:hypothetical protein
LNEGRFDLSDWGELDGVGEQIEQDLSAPAVECYEAGRNSPSYIADPIKSDMILREHQDSKPGGGTAPTICAGAGDRIHGGRRREEIFT